MNNNPNPNRRQRPEHERTRANAAKTGEISVVSAILTGRRSRSIACVIVAIVIALTAVMTVFNTGIGELGGTSVLDRIASGVTGGFLMIVVVTVLCDPLASALAGKLVK